MSMVRAFWVGAALAMLAPCSMAAAQQAAQPTMQRPTMIANPYGAMSFPGSDNLVMTRRT